jgi:hypothetical protein
VSALDGSPGSSPGAEGGRVDAAGAAGPAAVRRKAAPLVSSSSQRGLFDRLVDPEQMLAILQEELPRLAGVPIRVTRCSTKPARSRAAFREGRLAVAYKLAITAEDGTESDHVLLGVAPVTDAFPDEALRARCRSLAGHPLAAPFRELAMHLPALRLGLHVFPVDPSLPALAEFTGPDGARLMERFLPECRAGAALERIECELKHYKPFNRAVLRVTAHLRHADGRTSARAVYVKFFADDRGAESHRDLAALWPATRKAPALRVPEPLGYDRALRMLVMSEASGPRALTDWIKCIEKDEPLPEGVDLARVEAGTRVLAQALRDLQLSGVEPVRKRTFKKELGKLNKDLDLVRAELRDSHPDLVGRGEDLLRRLAALAPAEESLAPAHGGFRHKQMVGDETEMTVIDWDGLCLAHPALDPATFLGRLRQEPLRNPGCAAPMVGLADDFRRRFLELRPEIPPRELALYEAVVLTERTLRAFRRPSDGEETLQQILRVAQAADEMLLRAEG